MNDAAQLAALIAAAEKYFRLEPGMLLVSGGRYVPLVQYRQLVQLVAHERFFTDYSIGKAFGYRNAEGGGNTAKNIRVAREHIAQHQGWWLYTKADLVDAWDEALARSG